ncbi:MAG TPA: hypothetical protein VH250_06315 [Granulicella sp.]|jgi:hypothetical protein|nr:hypothetical protein [Granulicella sp.]
MTKQICCHVVLVMVGLLTFGKTCEAQTTSGAAQQIALAKPVSGSAGSVVLPVSPAPPAEAQTVGTEPKQTALALETDKLAAMAAELKLRVDKTNKDILSLEVVQEAQAIEQLAHQMKQGSGKR